MRMFTPVSGGIKLSVPPLYSRADLRIGSTLREKVGSGIWAEAFGGDRRFLERDRQDKRFWGGYMIFGGGQTAFREDRRVMARTDGFLEGAEDFGGGG